MADFTYGIDWTDDQNDLIVADYFAMLNMSNADEAFVKSHRYAEMAKLIGKKYKAVEAKHQNISAVLERLGMQWLKGLAPRRNFQGSLIAAVDRYLSARPSLTGVSDTNPTENAFSEKKLSWAGPQPSLAMVAPPQLEYDEHKTTEALSRLIRKFDPALRDSRNRKLGYAGEELVLHFEREKLRAAGRYDLAQKIEWTSQERGDGAGYDIASFAANGDVKLIEVKTTNGPATTPFFLSENERQFSEERFDAFHLVRLFDFSVAPQGFELRPPLEKLIALQPTSYRATLHCQ